MCALKLVQTIETMEGEGARVKRLMPVGGLRNFDPIVLWDHFLLEAGMGFPDHPHRGFEGITYLFKGEMHHKDNLGNSEKILAGGVQRFTAGGGIVHSEMPSQTGKTEGIQLWINLAKKDKPLPPAYHQLQADDLPVERQDGITRTTIIGNGSPLALHTETLYQRIDIDGNRTLQQVIPDRMQGVLYVADGKVRVGTIEARAGDAILIEQETSLDIQALESSSLMLCVGKPHGEPIIQYGPFVD